METKQENSSLPFNEKLESLLTHGYSFQWREYINQGIELFKTYPGGLLGFSLLFFAVNFALLKFPLFGPVVSGFLYSIHQMCLFLVMKRIALKEKYEFPNFFNVTQLPANVFLGALLEFAFKWATAFFIFLPAIVIAVLLSFGFVFRFSKGLDMIPYSIEKMIPFFMESTQGPFGWTLAITVFFLSLLLFVLPSFLISWVFVFNVFLLIDKRLSPTQALKASQQIVFKRWPQFLLFYFALYLVTAFGILITFGIGVILLLPIQYCILFAAYQDIVGLNKELID